MHFKSPEGKEKQTKEYYDANYVKHDKITLVVLFVVLFLIAFSFLSVVFLEKDSVYPIVEVEAGFDVTPNVFLKNAKGQIHFTQRSDTVDINVPGDYKMTVSTGLMPHAVTLSIQDTIPPELLLKELQIESGSICSINDFIDVVNDATAVSCLFTREPDFDKLGTQVVEIAATDLGGNTVTQQTTLTISGVNQTVVREAGAKAPDISLFVIGDADASFITDLSQLDLSVIGTHDIIVESKGKQYTSQLIIKDPAPPKLFLKNVRTFINMKCEPSEFVSMCEDVTAVTYRFEKEPDVSTKGAKKVVIIAEDEGGNTTSKEGMLIVEEDTTPPVITGAKNFSVSIGNSIDFESQITVTDNIPEGVKLSVDTSQLNIKKEGTYPVTYTATDMAGNTTSKKITVTIKGNGINVDAVYAMADNILAQIITDDMTNREKAERIYSYVKGNMRYVGFSDKSSWVVAAYNAMKQRKGDCYSYYAFSKALLDRAGIANDFIEKMPGYNSKHYWNLVDLGDGHGWYHFDTTPRVAGGNFCLLTDDELMEYSNVHNNSHIYDRDKYYVP